MLSNPYVLEGFLEAARDAEKEANLMQGAGNWAKGALRTTGQFVKNLPRSTWEGIKATPGALKNTVLHPRQSFKTGVEAMKQWDPVSKTIGIGSAGLMAHDNMKAVDPYTGRKRGMGERVIGTGAGLFADVASAPMGFIAGTTANMVVGGAGARVGRSVDNLVGGRG